MSERHINKKLFFNKYKIKKLIIKTSCCLLYEGINIKENEPVAMKFENRSGEYNVLESEAYLLFYLKGFGIPKIITFGKSGNYNILIQKLLGLSINELWKLRKNKNEKELLKNICMIALQCLDRLEYIHSKDIVHGDIKPQNFLIGRKDPKTIYLIDFGFSHKYRSSRTGKHIKFKSIKMIYGSFKFISLNGNKGYEISRRDDLESLGYMLIFLAKNTLPWLNINCPKINNEIIIREILRIKNSTSPEILCSGLPKEFTEYYKYSKNLYFEQEPNYKYLKSLFTSILSKNEQINDLLFFWIINKKKEKTIENNEELRNSYILGRKESCHKRLYNQIKKSLEKVKNKKNEKLNLTKQKNPTNLSHIKKNNYKICNYIKFEITHKNNTINSNIINQNDTLRMSGKSYFGNMENNISCLNGLFIDSKSDDEDNCDNIKIKLKKDIIYKSFYEREKQLKKDNNNYAFHTNKNEQNINDSKLILDDTSKYIIDNFLENEIINETIYHYKNIRNTTPINRIRNINTPKNKTKNILINKDILNDINRKNSQIEISRNSNKYKNHPIFHIRCNKSVMNNFYNNNINITINNI